MRVEVVLYIANHKTINFTKFITNATVGSRNLSLKKLFWINKIEK